MTRNQNEEKGEQVGGPWDNVGLLSLAGCASGILNEPFIPDVKRPPGLMSLLLTHPAPALSLFPSVSHSRMTAD